MSYNKKKIIEENKKLNYKECVRCSNYSVILKSKNKHCNSCIRYNKQKKIRELDYRKCVSCNSLKILNNSCFKLCYMCNLKNNKEIENNFKYYNRIFEDNFFNKIL